MIFFLLLFNYVFLIATSEPIYQNSTNICQKCGCAKSDDAQTLTLDCTGKNFAYILANWPPHNKTIRAIFTGNNFTSLERLPETDAVVEVVLSRCNIKYLYPGVFEACTNTKFVDFSHNYLTSEELSADRFQGPYIGSKPGSVAIEDLNLSYNQIHTLYKNVFDFLPNLTTLNLEGNDFVVLDAHTQLALGNVPGLLSLNLANNELTELVLAAIENLKSLVRLDLSENELDFVPHSLKSIGKSLEVLTLDGNPIVEMAEDSFSGLDTLIQISANNLTKLTHINASAFAAVIKLTKLSLCNNSFLKEIDVDAFGPNSTLKELHLKNNSLTTIPYKLLRWSLLDTLDLKNNPFSCTCDLYNITRDLSADITRNKDGPTCIHPISGASLQVYALKSDICSVKIRKMKLLRHHISIPLTLLIVIMVMALMVAIGLGQQRYRKFMQRKKNDYYTGQAIYSPLLNV